MGKNKEVIDFLNKINFFDKLSLLDDILIDLYDDLEDSLGEVILTKIPPIRIFLHSKRKSKKESFIDIYGGTPETFVGANHPDSKIDRFIDDCNFGSNLFFLIRYELEFKFAEGIKQKSIFKDKINIIKKIISNFCDKLEYSDFKIKLSNYSSLVWENESDNPEYIIDKIYLAKSKSRKSINFTIHCSLNLDNIKESISYDTIISDRREDFMELSNKYRITIKEQKKILKIIESLK